MNHAGVDDRPAGRLGGVIARTRRGLWHLRTGGPSQLREFLRRERLGQQRPESYLGAAGKGSRRFRTPPPAELPPRRAVRVGIIADEFTSTAFRGEWHQVPLDPEAWLAQLDGLDLVLVESAWAGNDGAWRYHLTGSSAPRPALVDLLAECRRRGLPTIFWNKEDPTHFEDFLDSAALCDWVFTTDANCLAAYRERLGHPRVGVLPFAVADRICNPVRLVREHQPLGVAFAGTWFAHKYPERRDQMRLLFDAARRVCDDHVPFEIYSRFQGVDERYEFPEPYASHVVGSLDYPQMLSAYRSHKVFLNVNTVTDSPTMCARRVLEITACGTPVVSTPAPALEYFLGDGIVQVDDPSRAREALGRLVRDADARARLVHLGQRQLWRQHTYGHRVDTMLAAVGVDNPAPVRLPPTSVLAATRRPAQLDHLLRQVAAQQEVDVELLVATHQFEAPDLVARARTMGLDRVTVVPMSSTQTLGDCLNALADRASGQVLAKMDDDDLYGPQYLADLLRAMHYSDAELVGKHCRYVHLAAYQRTMLIQSANEHRFTHFVAGPTLTWRAELGLRFGRLTRGEDSDFLQRVGRAGGRIYAADRFNFVQMRSGDPGGHTWGEQDDTFLRSGTALPAGVDPML